jgi:hypothetical protein
VSTRRRTTEPLASVNRMPSFASEPMTSWFVTNDPSATVSSAAVASLPRIIGSVRRKVFSMRSERRVLKP